MKALYRLYRALLVGLGCSCLAPLAMAAPGAELRSAVTYLEAEVPKWKRNNGCYSCHNDGDGLRALIAAHRAGVKVDAAVMTGSLKALDDPAAWEAKPLARLQFASVAREAVAAGLIKPSVLEAAAAAIAADQDRDGHWKVEEELAAGSPVTYGPVLATFLARRVLEAASAGQYAGAIGRASRWLESRKPQHVLDLAAVVLALGRAADRSRLAAAQLSNGSWNNEPFDTAIAMLALRRAGGERVRPAIGKARAWLASRQLPGGGWPGTTRPAGGESYAQHLSTTAWTAIALAEVSLD